MATLKCATVGCQSPATHNLTWVDGDETITEAVCQPCGEAYCRRPALRASMTDQTTSDSES